MIMDLKATTKEATIDEMIDRYAQVGVISDKADYKKHILAREAESTTGIGDGIAMPHAKTDSVKKAAVLFAKSSQGVDFNALDGQPVHLFFMIAAPAGANNEHLQALATLSSLLINPSLVASLKKADTPDEVLSLFSAAEEKKEAEDAQEEKDAAATQAAVGNANTAQEPAGDIKKPYVVAVTACPTGIAHTYMAEAALKEEAKKMGVAIKVETNGSEGIKHRLTADDISRAIGVIIAADKKVEMNRFAGKHLINRPVIDGINKPHELIEDTLAEKGPIFQGNGEAAASDSDISESPSLARQAYASLMNGISNMLPFVVGGGIIMALSFLLERIPGVGAKSIIFTFTNGLGSAAFGFLVPVLAAYIAEAIGDRPALLPGFVAGWMASNTGFSVIASKNGVAGFLGGLVGGFLAGFIILVLKKWFKNLPKSLDGLKPVFIFPILSLLAIGLIMYFAINPVFTAINLALIGWLEGLGTTNVILVGTILGGMMAIDMGGPFNKAAYVFSIGVFMSSPHQTDGRWMAAVMAGGMVPPLAIALATTIWPKKWTQAERTSGLSDYLLGLSFITEGAIPFAAADPLRIITSSIIGAAIAGGLTQFMGVNVPAPHGGIFAALLANKPLQFILAVVVGSVISGVILGLWKKERPDNGLDEAKA